VPLQWCSRGALWDGCHPGRRTGPRAWRRYCSRSWPPSPPSLGGKTLNLQPLASAQKPNPVNWLGSRRTRLCLCSPGSKDLLAWALFEERDRLPNCPEGRLEARNWKEALRGHEKGAELK
jgi:hypothetical protein